MNFLRNLFQQSIKKDMASVTEGNSNITRELSLDESYSEANNLSTLEIESYLTDNKDENDTSVPLASIAEFGNGLANVTPIEISTNDTNKEPDLNKVSDNEVSEDARILNMAAEVDSVINGRKDELDINQKDNLKQTQNPYEATVSNDTIDINNVIDEETKQSLKEFEETLKCIDITTLPDDSRSDLIDLDEIFDELDVENDDLIPIHSFTVLESNENATLKEKEITDAINEINSNIGDNIEIISINSSTEDEESQTIELVHTNSKHKNSDESDSDVSYNSSDFEFISETEANMTGIIINFKVEKYQNLSQNSPEPVIQCFNAEETSENAMYNPGEGPSRENRPRSVFEDRSYRNNHQIPLGDDFLGLFQGIYNPLLPMSEIYFLENKSVRTSAMNSQYDGLGFDKQLALRRHQPDSSEDEFEEEARESAKKILGMYPGQNRKRRRRYL